jgi:anionic cell wall polymer biosynthesis LytR-Cps2A-Psr (LCP) family protein
MKNNRPSLDGFVPRRPGSQLGELHGNKHPDAKIEPIDRSLHTGDDTVRATIGVERPNKAIGRIDIDESLREIDDEPEKLSRRKRKKLQREGQVVRPRSKVKRIIKWAIILILIFGVVVGGYLGLKVLLASNSIFTGSIFDLIQNQPLKQDENGRSNFLIVGTSEDDPGHDAGYLTDSIMVLSIDQKNKNAYTFSIPRDLYVDYDGQACLTGYKGKINVYFSCVNDGTSPADEQDRLAKTQAFIGNIVGLDIQYGAHVNYTVMRDIINAIGGSITVTIDSRDPAGVMDSNFDWKCGASFSARIKNCPPNGHFIQYPNGPVVLDAEHALYLAQARGDIEPTYGFEQSNFDRERNQQKILVAIKEKAMSAGTASNLGAVTGLIDALGNNLRTNIQTKEIRTIMQLAVDIKSSDIKSVDLYTADNPVFTTGVVGSAGSSVIPKAGVGEYGDLQAFIAKALTSDPIVREAANIAVFNGSGVPGAGQTKADALMTEHFTISQVTNAPEGSYDPIEIYQINKDKTATAAKLKEIYGVTLKTTTPPLSVTGNTDFVIIVGPAKQ